ncbi:hypothetical protein KAH55_02990 [bacterium]|nr:hypothetical protein [bacterium]
MKVKQFKLYSEVRAEFSNGDLLLFKGHSLASWLIRKLTHSPYSHVGMIYKNFGRVFCIEAVSKGVRIALMSELVKHYDGAIDYYTVKADPIIKNKALTFAFQQLGLEYDTTQMVRLGWALLTGAFVKSQQDQFFFCSELLAQSYAAADYPLSDSHPSLTSPSAIANSKKTTYDFTLKNAK